MVDADLVRALKVGAPRRRHDAPRHDDVLLLEHLELEEELPNSREELDAGTQLAVGWVGVGRLLRADVNLRWVGGPGVAGCLGHLPAREQSQG